MYLIKRSPQGFPFGKTLRPMSIWGSDAQVGINVLHCTVVTITFRWVGILFLVPQVVPRVIQGPDTELPRKGALYWHHYRVLVGCCVRIYCKVENDNNTLQGIRTYSTNIEAIFIKCHMSKF